MERGVTEGGGSGGGGAVVEKMTGEKHSVTH